MSAGPDGTGIEFEAIMERPVNTEVFQLVEPVRDESPRDLYDAVIKRLTLGELYSFFQNYPGQEVGAFLAGRFGMNE